LLLIFFIHNYKLCADRGAMLGVRVRKGNAEKARLLLSGSLDKSHTVLRRGSFVFFPLAERPDGRTLKGLRALGVAFSNVDFMPQKRQKSYTELMKRTSGAESGEAARGYDLLGNIAIIDASPAPAKRMASALMRTNRNIKTVLRKGGAVSGRFRTRKFYYVAGRRNYIANYRENGCVFRFDVRDVFFSPRLAHERKRVSGLVKDGESVVVMFSGVGPFAIEIAKMHRRCRVVAIELNAKAHRAAVENKRLNKVDNVDFVQGDVKKLASKYEGSADRIVMPLPKGASRFLGEAILVAKDRCVVHYYAFCKSDQEDETVGKIRAFAESRGRRFRLFGKRVVRPYSRTEIEIAVDFLISVKAYKSAGRSLLVSDRWME